MKIRYFFIILFSIAFLQCSVFAQVGLLDHTNGLLRSTQEEQHAAYNQRVNEIVINKHTTRAEKAERLLELRREVERRVNKGIFDLNRATLLYVFIDKAFQELAEKPSRWKWLKKHWYYIPAAIAALIGVGLLIRRKRKSDNDEPDDDDDDDGGGSPPGGPSGGEGASLGDIVSSKDEESHVEPSGGSDDASACRAQEEENERRLARERAERKEQEQLLREQEEAAREEELRQKQLIRRAQESRRRAEEQHAEREDHVIRGERELEFVFDGSDEQGQQEQRGEGQEVSQEERVELRQVVLNQSISRIRSRIERQRDVITVPFVQEELRRGRDYDSRIIERNVQEFQNRLNDQMQQIARIENELQQHSLPHNFDSTRMPALNEQVVQLQGRVEVLRRELFERVEREGDAQLQERQRGIEQRGRIERVRSLFAQNPTWRTAPLANQRQRAWQMIEAEIDQIIPAVGSDSASELQRRRSLQAIQANFDQLMRDYDEESARGAQEFTDIYEELQQLRDADYNPAHDAALTSLQDRIRRNQAQLARRESNFRARSNQISIRISYFRAEQAQERKRRERAQAEQREREVLAAIAVQRVMRGALARGRVRHIRQQRERERQEEEARRLEEERRQEEARRQEEERQRQEHARLLEDLKRMRWTGGRYEHFRKRHARLLNERRNVRLSHSLSQANKQIDFKRGRISRIVDRILPGQFRNQSNEQLRATHFANITDEHEIGFITEQINSRKEQLARFDRLEAERQRRRDLQKQVSQVSDDEVLGATNQDIIDTHFSEVTQGSDLGFLNDIISQHRNRLQRQEERRLKQERKRLEREEFLRLIPAEIERRRSSVWAEEKERRRIWVESVGQLADEEEILASLEDERARRQAWADERLRVHVEWVGAHMAQNLRGSDYHAVHRILLRDDQNYAELAYADGLFLDEFEENDQKYNVRESEEPEEPPFNIFLSLKQVAEDKYEPLPVQCYFPLLQEIHRRKTWLRDLLRRSNLAINQLSEEERHLWDPRQFFDLQTWTEEAERRAQFLTRMQELGIQLSNEILALLSMGSWEYDFLTTHFDSSDIKQGFENIPEIQTVLSTDILSDYLYTLSRPVYVPVARQAPIAVPQVRTECSIQ